MVRRAKPGRKSTSKKVPQKKAPTKAKEQKKLPFAKESPKDKPKSKSLKGKESSVPKSPASKTTSSSVPLTKSSTFADKMRDKRPERPANPAHILVEALAGTGKTFTEIVGVGYAFGKSVWSKVEDGIYNMIPENKRPQRKNFKIIPSEEQAKVWEAFSENSNWVKSIVYCAFNKSIVTEFSEKWGWLVKLLSDECGVSLRFATINSLGYGVVNQAYGRVRPNSFHTENLLIEKLGYRDRFELRRRDASLAGAVPELVGLCKLTLTGWTPEGGFLPNSITDDDLDRLCSFYDVEMNGARDRVYPLVIDLLKQSSHPDGEIDFDDQNWLPVINNLPIPKVDMVMVDEAQDLNRCKQEFCRRLGHLLTVVGDANQAIYGFAGADTDSIPRMRALLKVENPLQLTETRRCGRAIVMEAQKYVPSFRAHESNPLGIVRETTLSRYGEDAVDGDMVLCRVNAPLVSQALRMIANGRKAIIRGRDFGQNLIAFVNRMKCETIPELIMEVENWSDKEIKKEQAKRNPSESRILAIQDKVSCLVAFCSGVNTVQEVIERMNTVFTGKQCPLCKKSFNENMDRCPNQQCKIETLTDANGNVESVGPLLKTPSGVMFSSIHRAKGLEAKRVFILKLKDAPMPHPMAKLAWEKEQEQHLIYVAITRAIEELVYVFDDPK